VVKVGKLTLHPNVVTDWM